MAFLAAGFLAGAAIGGFAGYGLGRWSSPWYWGSPYYYYAPQNLYAPYRPNYYPYSPPVYPYPSYPVAYGWYPGYGYGYW